jgi:excisionase family DNA binding protein
MQQRMLTVAEAASQIGVSTRTAYLYIRQRRLLATRVGPGTTRVTQAAIDEFLFNCTDRPTPICPCQHGADTFLAAPEISTA